MSSGHYDMREASILVLGEFDARFRPHAATNDALEHAAKHTGSALEVSWISSDDVDASSLNSCDGLLVAPGSPYRNLRKTLEAIQFARENEVPLLGTCGGFQHVIIEYARNVLGYHDAQHAEYDPYASNLFISALSCSLAGRRMDLRFIESSHVARLYGASSSRENYYCNFGVNPELVPTLKSGPLLISGSDAEGEIRVVESPGHPFFVATLFVPQDRSTPQAPHPLIVGFVRAAISHRAARGDR